MNKRKYTARDRFFTVALVLTALILNSGCTPREPLEPGRSFYNQIMGELQASERRPLDSLWMASQRALEVLELRIVAREKDALSALLRARGAEGKEVKVRLEKVSDSTTLVKVKVDLLGDQHQSQLILDQILREMAND